MQCKSSRNVNAEVNLRRETWIFQLEFFEANGTLFVPLNFNGSFYFRFARPSTLVVDLYSIYGVSRRACAYGRSRARRCEISWRRWRRRSYDHLWRDWVISATISVYSIRGYPTVLSRKRIYWSCSSEMPAASNIYLPRRLVHDIPLLRGLRILLNMNTLPWSSRPYVSIVLWVLAFRDKRWERRCLITEILPT